MNKREFINILTGKIISLPQEEINKSIEYYSEIIDDKIEDGMEDEAAVDSLGSIDEIAKNIMCDMPITTLMKAKVNESKKKVSNNGIWILLLILGFPIWFPLLISLSAVLFSIYVVIWSVIITLFSVVLSFALAGIAGMIAGSIYISTVSVSYGLCIIGMSLVCSGLTVLLIKPTIWLAKKLVKLTSHFIKKIKLMFISNRKVYDYEK